MLNVFIGWDPREIEAYHVLCHSIITRSSVPVSIAPVKKSHLQGIYLRDRHPTESTEFSLTRFLVPYLSNYQGYSIFMDCDMLCLADLTTVMAHIDPKDCVSVVQHSYIPKTAVKMDGCIQTRYERKNWSSFMVFNNAKCRALCPDNINRDDGLNLHAFNRLERIGSLPKEWNWLVGEYEPNQKAKILHYTLGGPWMSGYSNCDHANEWYEERRRVFYPI